MSAINTNGINVNYPVPGVNNDTQGFRTNFAAIKTNLNTAGTEITDLQNKVVVKQALANTVVNNDMGNTLISNASILGFRHTSYNLGSNLSGTVLVNCTLGDVQYGTVSANTSLQFGSWVPAGTLGTIYLELGIGNSSAVISFPPEVQVSNNNGSSTLENFANVGNVVTVTAPAGVTQLDFKLTSLDCGNTITVEPYNRPRQATQIQQRSPAPTGLQGDVAGTTCVDPEISQLTVTQTYANDLAVTSSTSSLYVDMPVVCTGSSFGGVTSGTTYYIANIASATTFTIASTVGGANVNLSADTGNMYLNPARYLYVATDSYNSTTYSPTVSATSTSGNITLSSTSGLVVNAPVTFSGTLFGGLSSSTTYYIKSIPGGGNITVAQSRVNGVAGSTVALTNGSPAPNTTCTMTAYVGSDIWQRIQLNPW